MPLTQLTINGFKSFADKTEIKFDEGVTGIVGPNGSGKSNITEAIRWVMGESSAKSLRGSNMKDVIFAGSEFRKPLNKAEVNLIFDNRDRALALDSDKVVITRRILRSGDNEYLINNAQVRQKDVRSLFLDSGIASDSLAIISQGKVDEILNSKPEQRRSIFEEAAGVLHFKEQKQVAQRQLEQTNENLVRITDLVGELKARVEPLEAQASLAKQYLFEKKGLDEHRKTLLAFEIEELDEQRSTLSEQAAKNKQILSKLDTEVKQSQAAVAQKRLAFTDKSATRDDLQQQLLDLTQQISNLNTDIQMSTQSNEYDQATKNEYETQARSIQDRIDLLTKQAASLSNDQQQFKDQLQTLQANRAKLAGEIKTDPQALSNQLEQARADYIQLLQDQTSNNNQLTYLAQEKAKLANFDASQDQRVKQSLQTAIDELSRQQAAGAKLKQERDLLKDKLANVQAQIDDVQAKLVKHQQTFSQQQTQLARLKAQKEALENVQKRHEGYYYGVKNVLNHLDRFPGVIGAVGELISFPAKYESALSTALGAGVQNLVTTNRLSARDAINQLKQMGGGRATFLPLDGLRFSTIAPSTKNTLSNFAGFIGIGSELVTAKSQIDLQPAIDYLLGAVIVVDKIDTALQVSKTINRYRIVTLDGDVISAGGSMTGGSRNKNTNSPLATSAEISSLSEKIVELNLALSQHQQVGQRLQVGSAAKAQESRKLQADLQQINEDLSSALARYTSQEQEVSRLKQASKLYDDQSKERLAQLQELEQEIATAKERQETLNRQANDDKAQIDQLQRQISDFDQLSQTLQTKLAELDPQIAVLKTKLDNLTSALTANQHEQAQSQAQLSELTSRLAAIDSSNHQSATQVAEMQTNLSKLERDKAALQQELRQLSTELGQLDAQISQLDEVASRNYELRKDAAGEQENLSVKLSQLQSQINQRLESLRADYAISYEAALAQAKIENTLENREQLQKRVKLHQMSIDELGPVNLSAIEEFDEVKQRYDFLSSQQADLLSARTDLEQSMAELDSEVKDRFNASFSAINQHFIKLFPQIFGGGNAKLILTNPDDLLTTGIEIIAQPPGKKLQRLSLLSGGERALTAIALLFAMLNTKPVPFCILDEVEAALDDVNVHRFGQFLTNYDMQTQFIVITHRRGTMEHADQLYGVVMQESGVSQVLSVSLKDLKDEVN